MSRKAKYTLEQKIKACEEYISGVKSASRIAQELNMTKHGRKLVIDWSKKYKDLGVDAFISASHNNQYTKEFKLNVVREYNSGLGSHEELAIKYNIRSRSTVSSWISKYNRHEELQEYTPVPEVYKMKARKTIKEERIEIVEWYLNNGRDYKKTAAKFKCSYTQVYNWVKKYNLEGEEGLDDRRGKRKVEEDLTDQEKLKKENDRLNRRNEELEREIELLKKLNAFEWME